MNGRVSLLISLLPGVRVLYADLPLPDPPWRPQVCGVGLRPDHAVPSTLRPPKEIALTSLLVHPQPTIIT